MIIVLIYRLTCNDGKIKMGALSLVRVVAALPLFKMKISIIIGILFFNGKAKFTKKKVGQGHLGGRLWGGLRNER